MPDVAGVHSVTSWLTADEDGKDRSWAPASDALVGSLVHRLLQSVGDADGGLLPDAARALLTPEERATIPELDDVIARATANFTALRARPDVVALLASGIVMREVPFSMVLDPSMQSVAPERKDQDLTPGVQSVAPERKNQDLTPATTAVLRGRIDLLVVREDGSVVVVEVKTGRRRQEHERQLAIYVHAAQALFPGRTVEGCLLYS